MKPHEATKKAAKRAAFFRSAHDKTKLHTV